MANHKVPFAFGEYYHIYNRGNSKQVICKDKADFTRLQELLFVCNNTSPVSIRDARAIKNGLYAVERKQCLVAVGAYCLMSNHFHLLLTPLVEGGVSEYMRKVSTGYAMYFNRRHKRTGSLFEGNFKSKHVAEDRYLKYLFSYIHLNPVATMETANFSPRSNLGEAKRYSYSSLIDYNGATRDQGGIIASEFFPDFFPTDTIRDAELLDWLENEEEL